MITNYPHYIPINKCICEREEPAIPHQESCISDLLNHFLETNNSYSGELTGLQIIQLGKKTGKEYTRFYGSAQTVWENPFDEHVALCFETDVTYHMMPQPCENPIPEDTTPIIEVLFKAMRLPTEGELWTKPYTLDELADLTSLNCTEEKEDGKERLWA